MKIKLKFRNNWLLICKKIESLGQYISNKHLIEESKKVIIDNPGKFNLFHNFKCQMKIISQWNKCILNNML